MKFFKYQGTGNDFIMVDNRESSLPKNVNLVKRLCDRKFGIGSDGIIYIEKSDSVDFIMDFYNPDGSQSFCGNGSRCAVSFANFLGMVDSSCTFEAIDGIHQGAVLMDNKIRVKMLDVPLVNEMDGHYFVDTGSPHYVEEVADLNIDMVEFGRSIRYNDTYKAHGTNVNAMCNGVNHVDMRTYERGVENETLSCGTGVTAVALVAFTKGWYKEKVNIKTKGGLLTVEAERNGSNGYKNIWLSGSAKCVFEGEIDV